MFMYKPNCRNALTTDADKFLHVKPTTKDNQEYKAEEESLHLGRCGFESMAHVLLGMYRTNVFVFQVQALATEFLKPVLAIASFNLFLFVFSNFFLALLFGL